MHRLQCFHYFSKSMHHMHLLKLIEPSAPKKKTVKTFCHNNVKIKRITVFHFQMNAFKYVIQIALILFLLTFLIQKKKNNSLWHLNKSSNIFSDNCININSKVKCRKKKEQKSCYII